MRTRYLTRRGGTYVFQMRVPRALDPHSSLPASAREVAGIPRVSLSPACGRIRGRIR